MKVSFSPSAKKDPQSEGGVKIPYGPSKRNSARILWWFILLIISIPFIILLAHILMGWLFTSSQGAVAMESFSVNAPEAGIVREILVKKGDEVKAGQGIAKISQVPSPELLEKIAMLDAERGSLSYSEGSVSYAAPSRSSVKLADEAIAYLKREVSTMRRLMSQGAATRAEVNLAEEQLRLAKANRSSLFPVRTADTTRRASQLSRRAYLDNASSYLKRLSEASHDVVISRSGRVDAVNAVTGQTVAAGDSLVQFADPSTAKIIVYVDPKDYERVKNDSKVNIVMPGTKRRFSATVDQMPTMTQNIPGGLGESILAGMRMVSVYVRPDEPLRKEELINGLPVRVEWGIRFFN